MTQAGDNQKRTASLIKPNAADATAEFGMLLMVVKNFIYRTADVCMLRCTLEISMPVVRTSIPAWETTLPADVIG